MIVGEIREDCKFRGKSDDGDDVGFGHLLLDEFFGGVVGADQIVGLHGSEVEEEDDQAAVAQLVAGGCGGGCVRAFVIHRDYDGFRVYCCGGFDLFDVFV